MNTCLLVSGHLFTGLGVFRIYAEYPNMGSSLSKIPLLWLKIYSQMRHNKSLNILKFIILLIIYYMTWHAKMRQPRKAGALPAGPALPEGRQERGLQESWLTPAGCVQNIWFKGHDFWGTRVCANVRSAQTRVPQTRLLRPDWGAQQRPHRCFFNLLRKFYVRKK